MGLLLSVLLFHSIVHLSCVCALSSSSAQNTRSVPACSQEPVDSFLETTQQEMTSFTIWVFKAATAMKLYCKLGGGGGFSGIVWMLKSLQKQLQRSHKQSENRCTSPKIDDVFRTIILLLLLPAENIMRVSFLVHQVLRTSATVLRCWQMFKHFSLCIWVSEYTCHPMIANLLYTFY